MDAAHRIFRELCDPCLDACLLLEADGRLVDANQAGLRLLDLDRLAVAGVGLQSKVATPAAELGAYLAVCRHNRQQMPAKLTFLGPDGQAEVRRCLGHRVQLAAEQDEPLIFLRCAAEEASRASRFIALNQQLERQRQLHHQLKAERDLLEAIAENAGAGLAVISRDYRTLWANNVIFGIWGDTIGKPCYAVYCQRDSVCPWCGVREIFETGRHMAKTEATCYDKNGNLVYLEITATALYDKQGGIGSVLELMVPVTERRLLENRLRDDERRAESLYRLAQIPWASSQELLTLAVEEAVALTNSEMGFIHLLADDRQDTASSAWSQGAKAACGLPQPKHLPLAGAGLWAEPIRQRQAVRVNDYPTAVLRQGLPAGHVALCRFLGVPLVVNEAVVAVIGVANKAEPYDSSDERQLALFQEELWAIIQRKRMERAVFIANQRWELTFDAIDEVVTIHDPEMRILRANKAAAKLLGREPSAMVGHFCYELFAGRSEPCASCPELLAKDTRTPQSMVVRHTFRQARSFDVSSFPILQDGQLQGFVHIAKDITAEKTLEAQLRQAQKMEAIGTLAAGIAHDFNNILVPIMGYSEIVKSRVEADSPIAAELDHILHAAYRAKDLVRQILSFSRQTAQERWPLKPYLVIKEALKFLRASLPSTIDIRQELDADCGAVLADPTQLHQIIMNLATNAYHAMRDTGGTLGVGLERLTIAADDSRVRALGFDSGDYLRITVSDTGKGMDRHTMERIFEPYFTTKPQGEGTGMGLAVVMGIVKGCGGHITVDSEPGSGTVFHVYLPRLEAAEPGHEEARAAAAALPTGSERILVVDDEQAVTGMLTLMLQELGYRVTVTNESPKALAMLQADPDGIDLLITDMTMPGLTGIDLVRALRRLRPALPVLLITGFSDLLTKDKVEAAGIRKVLMKPATVGELARALRELLD